MEQDFFTEHDFYNLKRFAGQSKDSNNSEHSEVYEALLQPYERVRRLASLLQQQIFPEGYIKIRRRPTNQRNNFQEYLWAKIYPSKDSPKELAFTVEINAEDKFIVKIDTVGLDENDPRRVNYENYRGSWYGSNIVLHLPYQEVYPFGWERLLEISTEFINRNIQSYRELEAMFSRIEGIESDEESSDDRTDDKKEVGGQPGPAIISIKNPFKQTSLDSDSIHSNNNRDLLGFENDIRSFASLIALKALQPPLAIALFGKWGSGKSFFMHHLQQQIEHLRTHQAFKNSSTKPNQEEEPYCKGVVQITFNAWSYMDVNLWAALVAQIFEKLDHYINDADLAEEKLNEAREILAEHLTVITDSKTDLVADKKRLLEEAESKVRKLQFDIKSSQANKEKLVKEMKDEVREKIESKIRAEFPIDEVLLTELKEHGVEEKDLSVDKIIHEIGVWRLFFRNMLTFKRKQVLVILAIALIFCWIVIDPGKMISGVINQALKNAIAISSMVTPVIVWGVKKWKQYQPFYTKLSSYRDQFNQRVEETAREDIEKDIERNKKELERKNQEIKAIECQINKVENEIRHSITGKAFFNFIQDKRNDERYDKSLSIISTIRKDFETLSGLFMRYGNEEQEKQNEKELSEEEKKVKADAMKLQKLFKGKPLDRIILYIDDLDRCSEERVVEVLEAVNLLMAFPLFVVVVGVDPRWIKNALIKKYTLQFTGILGKQELVEKYKLEPIQVSDYLEKIFQIPFHLKEPEDMEVHGFLTSLLIDQTKKDKTAPQEKDARIDEDENENDYVENGYVKDGYFQQSSLREVSSIPTQLEISTTELSNLKQLSWLVGNNPRSLKRYVNIYRIIRAHENLTYNNSESGQEKNFLCVIFLMGLCIGRYSDLSAVFYENCLKDDQKSLKDLLEELNKDESVKGVFPIHKIPKELYDFKGADFNSYIPFVKRFSFEMNWN